MNFRVIKYLFFSFIIITVFLGAFYNQTEQKNAIRIGGKVFTEQNILVDILKVYLEEQGYTIKTQKNLGGTFVAYEALKNGNIDIYVEYTGTAYHSIFKQTKILKEQETYKWLKDRFNDDGVLIFEDLGFSNSYTLITLKDQPYKTINDLTKDTGKLSIGFEAEVLSRPDGYKNLIKAYQLNFKNYKTLNVGLLYEAIKNKQIDIGFGYTTDGRNQAYGLKSLVDTLNFFPKYKASILAKQGVLKKYNQLQKDLNVLTGLISDEEMTQLNYEVDALKKSSIIVARNFLLNKGLVSTNTKKMTKSFLGLQSYEYSLIRSKILEHIKICLIALLVAVMLSFTLGVLAFEYKPLKSLVFTFVNLMQTVPSLALFGFLIPFMGIGFWPAMVALVLYSILPLVHNIYVGLSEIETEIIESCQAIGMTKFQILTQVRIPIAMPTIGAGLRTSTVIIIGTATVAAFIGAGGLGELIFQGISSLDNRMILLGAIPAALLALLADFMVHFIMSCFTSEGLKK